MFERGMYMIAEAIYLFDEHPFSVTCDTQRRETFMRMQNGCIVDSSVEILFEPMEGIDNARNEILA